VRGGQPLALGDLVRQVGLSRATVSAIAREMSQSGLLEPLGPATSSGGRPPTLFRYRPAARFAAGVTLSDSQIIATLTDLEGNPLQFCHVPWQGTDPDQLLAAMAGAVEQIIAGVDRRHVLGVGVGLPGIIDVPSGQVLLCISMGWLGEPIQAREILSERLGLPVLVANRSRIAALGELRAGAGRGLESLLYMFLGEGVVAGIALAGGIYFGASSSAGEIGHTTVAPGGALCRCGNRGCLELYTSESAILAMAIARAREAPDCQLYQSTRGNLQALTLATVLACARQGDPPAIAAFNEAGTYLGMALSTALNLLNPQMLVIGGPVGCLAGPLLLEPVMREIQRRTFPLTLSAVRIVTGTSEDQCAALGAAALALDGVGIERIFAEEGTP
jgi:predicted NBD/HSP70 family sugar kinase